MMITINSASKTDLETIIKIEQENFKNSWSHKIFEDELSNKISIFLTIKVNQIIAGYIITWKLQNIAELQKISIAKTFQKQGLAQKLHDLLIKKIKEKNITRIILEVNELNKKAINFYIKNNYKQIAVRKKYYGNNAALILEKDLTQP